LNIGVCSSTLYSAGCNGELSAEPRDENSIFKLMSNVRGFGAAGNVKPSVKPAPMSGLLVSIESYEKQSTTMSGDNGLWHPGSMLAGFPACISPREN
jgi:hypothetical protein